MKTRHLLFTFTSYFASRSLLLGREIIGDPFNIGAQRSELSHNRLVTAIDMIDAIDEGLSRRAKCSEH